MKIKEVKYTVEDAGKEVVVTLRPQIAFRQTKQDLEDLVLDFAKDLFDKGSDDSE